MPRRAAAKVNLENELREAAEAFQAETANPEPQSPLFAEATLQPRKRRQISAVVPPVFEPPPAPLPAKRGRPRKLAFVEEPVVTATIEPAIVDQNRQLYAPPRLEQKQAAIIMPEPVVRVVDSSSLAPPASMAKFTMDDLLGNLSGERREVTAKRLRGEAEIVESAPTAPNRKAYTSPRLDQDVLTRDVYSLAAQNANEQLRSTLGKTRGGNEGLAKELASAEAATKTLSFDPVAAQKLKPVNISAKNDDRVERVVSSVNRAAHASTPLGASNASSQALVTNDRLKFSAHDTQDGKSISVGASNLLSSALGDATQVTTAGVRSQRAISQITKTADRVMQNRSAVNASIAREGIPKGVPQFENSVSKFKTAQEAVGDLTTLDPAQRASIQTIADQIGGEFEEDSARFSEQQEKGLGRIGTSKVISRLRTQQRRNEKIRVRVARGILVNPKTLNQSRSDNAVDLANDLDDLRTMGVDPAQLDKVTKAGQANILAGSENQGRASKQLITQEQSNLDTGLGENQRPSKLRTLRSRSRKALNEFGGDLGDESRRSFEARQEGLDNQVSDSGNNAVAKKYLGAETQTGEAFAEAQENAKRGKFGGLDTLRRRRSRLAAQQTTARGQLEDYTDSNGQPVVTPAHQRVSRGTQNLRELDRQINSLDRQPVIAGAREKVNEVNSLLGMSKERVNAPFRTELGGIAESKGDQLLKQLVALAEEQKRLLEKANQFDQDARHLADKGDTVGAATATTEAGNYRASADEAKTVQQEVRAAAKASRHGLAEQAWNKVYGNGITPGGMVGAIPAAIGAIAGTIGGAYTAGGASRQEEIRYYDIAQSQGVRGRAVEQFYDNTDGIRRIDSRLMAANSRSTDTADIMERIGMAGRQDQYEPVVEAAEFAQQFGISKQSAGDIAGGFYRSDRGTNEDVTRLLSVQAGTIKEGFKSGVAAPEMIEASKMLLEAAKELHGGAIARSSVERMQAQLQSIQKIKGFEGTDGADVLTKLRANAVNPEVARMGLINEKVKAEMRRTGKSFAGVYAPEADKATQKNLNLDYAESNFTGLQSANNLQASGAYKYAAEVGEALGRGSAVLGQAALENAGASSAQATKLRYAERDGKGSAWGALATSETDVKKAVIAPEMGSQSDGLGRKSGNIEAQAAELAIITSRSANTTAIDGLRVAIETLTQNVVTIDKGLRLLDADRQGISLEEQKRLSDGIGSRDKDRLGGDYYRNERVNGLRPANFSNTDPQRRIPGGGTQPLILANYGIGNPSIAETGDADPFDKARNTGNGRVTGGTTGTGNGGGNGGGNGNKPVLLPSAPLPTIAPPKTNGPYSVLPPNVKPPIIMAYKPPEPSQMAASNPRSNSDTLDIKLSVNGEVINAHTNITARATTASGRRVSIS